MIRKKHSHKESKGFEYFYCAYSLQGMYLYIMVECEFCIVCCCHCLIHDLVALVNTKTVVSLNRLFYVHWS